jgi:hypothetical protein
MHRARIMMLQAGREAEIVCLGHCRGGDGDDLREIGRTLSKAEAPDDPDAWLERRRNKTRERVRRHRRAIERVAAELLEHGRLPARRIDTIMRQEGARVISRINPERVPIEVRRARVWEWKTGRKVRIEFRDEDDDDLRQESS